MNIGNRSRIVLIGVACAFGLSAASLTVGPNNGGNAFPFGGPNSPFPGTHYQEAYDASLFSSTGPISITGIDFFLSTGTTLYFATYTIKLSTITVPVSSLANGFVSPGADNTLIASVTLSGTAPAVLSFSGGPFLYNPSHGNLLMDISIAPIAIGSVGNVGVTDTPAFYQDGGGSGPPTIARAQNFGDGTLGFGMVTRFDYNAVATVPITVTTNPASLTINVDGTAYVAPQTFNWIPGDSHSIGVVSPQGTGGQRYGFSGWSDSGGQTHNITVPSGAATYTATFATQYLLTLQTSGLCAGSISATPSSSSGYYNAGTQVMLTAVPGTGCQFAGWSGAVIGNTNGQILTISGPLTVTATFTSTCSYALATTSANVAATASTGSVGVTTNCPFTAQVPAAYPWIHITGTTSSAINYSVDANTGGARGGMIIVLDSGGAQQQAFTINQAAPACPGLTLSPGTITFNANGGSGTGTFNVPPCSVGSGWSASANQPWVHVPASGSSATFNFTVDSNNVNASRSATITVVAGGQTFTIAITENGLSCVFSLGTTDPSSSTGQNSSTSASFLGLSGGSGSIRVNLLAGQPACQSAPWTVSANATFIHPGALSGSGNGTISYTVDPNLNVSSTRSGTITVNTAAGPLTYTIIEGPLTTENYNCTQVPNAPTPALIRAEGEAELVSDLVVQACGTTIAGGVSGDVVVTLNAAITNHRLSTDPLGQTLDALLLLNEPGQGAVPGVNAFRGIIAGPNAVRFSGVPLAPSSGGNFTTTLRITNLRVDATQVAKAGTSAQVTGSVSFVAPKPIVVARPTQTLGTPQASSLHYTQQAPTTGPAPGLTIIPLQFTEGWANAFRSKQGESGFSNAALGNETGIATNGTRLVADITGVPAGVNVYAPLGPVSPAALGAQLVSADSNGVGGFPLTGTAVFGGVTYQLVPLTNGAGSVSWEVTGSDTTQIESLVFNLLIQNAGGVSTSTLLISPGFLGPQVVAEGPSTSAPVPRFINGPPPAPASLSVVAASAGGTSAPQAANGVTARAIARVATVGGNITTTGQVINSGSQTANNVTVGINYPTSYAILNQPQATAGGSCSFQANNATCTYPMLSPGQTASYTTTAMNTTSSSGGQLLYRISATSDSGNTDVITGAFTEPLPVPNVTLEAPTAGATVSGVVTVSGWALAVTATTIGSLQVTVDGTVNGTTTLTVPRPDICNNFPGAPGCPGPVGFTYAWNTAPVADGKAHTVCVLATGSDFGSNSSDTASACVQVTVGIGFPGAPTLLAPANGATVPATQALSWSAAGATYDVFFGTVNPPPLAVPNTAATTYSPALTAGQTYYWYVVAKNALGAGPPSAISSFTVQTVGPPSRINLTVWRQGNGTWYVNPANAPQFSKQWGLPPDIPGVGDFDGDGNLDYVIWRPAEGNWYITLFNGTILPLKQWGLAGDVPVPGDYDGDGKTDYAVWRPANGTWYITLSSNGSQVVKQWGLAGDIPVVADFDGDGKADFVVWRPADGMWYITLSSNGQQVVKQWGLTGDKPVAADFDHDGKADYAIWRPAEGNWYVTLSSNGQQVVTQWGLNGDIPVPRDYDGDGKADYAVWRPGNGTWYITPSSNPAAPIVVQWGLSGDVPIYKPAGN